MDQPFRVAILADIHGNLVALQAVLADVRASSPDALLWGGALVMNGPRTGNYNAGYQTMGPGAKISRADIAEFMLKQTNDKTYVGQAPTIRY